MKNKNKGFVGITLIIILVVTLTVGGTYYVTTKKNVDLQIDSTSTPDISTPKTSEIEEKTTVESEPSNASISVNTSVPVVTRTTKNTNPKISWSFKRVPQQMEHSTFVTLYFDGKAYDGIGGYPGDCYNLTKPYLVANEISGVACMYAGEGQITSIVKKVDNTFEVVKTTAYGDLNGDIMEITNRVQSEIILKIK